MKRIVVLGLASLMIVTARNPVCDLDIEPGKCRGTIPSYGYSKYDLMCIPFTYGGCGGNGNRFRKQEECERACEDDLLLAGS
ncbi:Kunitz-type serine protease inhibitor A [Trichostrongylus colubriformis]|uniref:Kunitz-type serine protease inhibitor A n=1 Tax=Trichostrongylus colubriformis TaxID=6319 RepID=A0AAN8FQ56_TRICO